MSSTKPTIRKVATVAPRPANASCVYDELNSAVENKNLKEIDELLKDERLDFTICKQFHQPHLQELIQKIFFLYKAESQKMIVDILQMFMKNGLHVNFILDKENHRMLHLAIKERMTEVIDFLISRNANLDLRDKAGNLILHYSIESESQKFKECQSSAEFERNSITFIEWIISKRLLQIDCKNEDGDTALHLAAKLNLLYMLPALLKFTMDVTIRNDRDLTAFQVFIDSVTNVSDLNFIFQPVRFAIACERFLEKGFSTDVIDENKITPLHRLLKNRVYNLVKVILKYRDYVETYDKEGNNELNIIMNFNDRVEDQDMVRILLAKGADVNKVNNSFISPLITAVRKRSLPMLRIFKEFNADFCHCYNGDYLWTYFFDEKCHSNVWADKDILRFLVHQGCDVNAKSGVGMSPLHLASRYGKHKLVEKLIKYGANVHCRESYDGYTPLHIAAYHNNDTIIGVLVKNEADVNAKCNKGQTPLHLCSKEAAVKKLIKLGAYVDVMDRDGLLPLHSAIAQRNGEAIKQLLKFGADFNDNVHVLNLHKYMLSSRYLSEYLIKLKAANLFVDGSYNKIIRYESQILEFKEKCVEEIKILKNYAIADHVSLYDFLRMCRDSACRHVQNDKLKELIRSPLELEKKFPIYHGVILSAYYIAVERRKMYEAAIDAFFYLANTRLPSLCMHEIFSYLSNSGLRSMIEAAKNKNDINQVPRV